MLSLETLQSIAEPVQNQEFFAEVGDSAHQWTNEKLKAFLNQHDIEYTVKNDEWPFRLHCCPFCKKGAKTSPGLRVKDGVPCYKCFHSSCDGENKKTFANFCKHFEQQDQPEPLEKPTHLPKSPLSSTPILKVVSLADLAAQFPNAPEVVISNLLRRGDVANFVGGPKSRKTFFVLQLGLSVADGKPFLDMPAKQGRVLFVDNELGGHDFHTRCAKIAEALGIDWQTVTKHIGVLKLRSTSANIETLYKYICSIEPRLYSLIVVDALYKAIPRGVDENSNSDMTQVYNLVNAIAEKHDCAVAVVHHTSKGTQAHKSVSDMGSGAGAQSRSADAHVVLRDHEEKDTITVQAIVRSLPPVAPFCITFDHPIWTLAKDKNPNAIAVTSKKSATVDEFVDYLPTSFANKRKTLMAVKKTLRISKNDIELLADEAVTRKLIEVKIDRNPAKPQLIRRLPRRAA